MKKRYEVTARRYQKGAYAKKCRFTFYIPALIVYYFYKWKYNIVEMVKIK